MCRRDFFPKASAKVRTFSHPAKLFTHFFRIKMRNASLDDTGQHPPPLYLYARATEGTKTLKKGSRADAPRDEGRRSTGRMPTLHEARGYPQRAARISLQGREDILAKKNGREGKEEWRAGSTDCKLMNNDEMNCVCDVMKGNNALIDIKLGVQKMNYIVKDKVLLQKL